MSIESGPLALVVALTPWALAAVAVGLIAAALARSIALAAAAAPLGVSIGIAIAPMWSSDSLPDAPHALTVASVSMTFGRADADAVVALVHDHDVDLLAVQELTPEAADALAAAGLDDVLPHSAAFPEPGFIGTGLWSSEPLSGVAAVEGFVSRTVRAQVESGGGLTVVAAHPAAPGALTHEAWSADTAALVDLADAIDGPALVVGDLNLTPDHRAFRDLVDAGYAHARDQAGAGLKPTFPEGRAPFPLVAIDHVLVRDTLFAADSVHTIAIPGADHRALIVTYAYAPGDA